MSQYLELFNEICIKHAQDISEFHIRQRNEKYEIYKLLLLDMFDYELNEDLNTEYILDINFNFSKQYNVSYYCIKYINGSYGIEYKNERIQGLQLLGDIADCKFSNSKYCIININIFNMYDCIISYDLYEKITTNNYQL
jgi:hypothetical protein